MTTKKNNKMRYHRCLLFVITTKALTNIWAEKFGKSFTQIYTFLRNKFIFNFFLANVTQSRLTPDKLFLCSKQLQNEFSFFGFRNSSEWIANKVMYVRFTIVYYNLHRIDCANAHSCQRSQADGVRENGTSPEWNAFKPKMHALEGRYGRAVSTYVCCNYTVDFALMCRSLH